MSTITTTPANPANSAKDMYYDHYVRDYDVIETLTIIPNQGGEYYANQIFQSKDFSTIGAARFCVSKVMTITKKEYDSSQNFLTDFLSHWDSTNGKNVLLTMAYIHHDAEIYPLISEVTKRFSHEQVVALLKTHDNQGNNFLFNYIDVNTGAYVCSRPDELVKLFAVLETILTPTEFSMFFKVVNNQGYNLIQYATSLGNHKVTHYLSEFISSHSP